MRNIYITNSPDKTKKLAKEIVSQFSGGEVVCLYGDLGAGKTAFVQGMIDYFIPGKRVLSPTFIIVRHYRINHKLIDKFLHVDLYRLQDIKEIRKLEFFESIQKSDSIVAIEWAEKLENLIPKPRIDIHIKNLDKDRREIKIKYVKS
ncbi:tRNA (adenosine(37)-N6)-threonylcarbamoyltransferase complex ATPase subunit type 1 TsaE [Candidatus Gottesmanbacteria bacterium]|nr:tRNA (adenosine(37)-N6)-threonylcarbamoyltransferase complex ATPase subunit type 1 TsaE [Candidatus Gottesmanbacteria bacterium]